MYIRLKAVLKDDRKFFTDKEKSLIFTKVRALAVSGAPDTDRSLVESMTPWNLILSKTKTGCAQNGDTVTEAAIEVMQGFVQDNDQLLEDVACIFFVLLLFVTAQYMFASNIQANHVQPFSTVACKRHDANLTYLLLKVTVQFERCFRLMEHIFIIL